MTHSSFYNVETQGLKVLEFKGWSKICKVECLKCGDIIVKNAVSIKDHGCVSCQTKSRCFDKTKRLMATIHPELIVDWKRKDEILSSYKQSVKLTGGFDLTCKCRVCKSRFTKSSITMVYDRKTGCSVCRTKINTQVSQKRLLLKQSEKEDAYSKKLYKLFPNLEILEYTPSTNGTKVTLKCKDCGNIRETTSKHVLNSVYGCKPCSVRKTTHIENRNRYKKFKRKWNTAFSHLKMIHKTRHFTELGTVFCSKHKIETTSSYWFIFQSKHGGCSECAIESKRSNFIRGMYKSKAINIKGKEFQLMGYEPKALKYMLRHFSLDQIEAECHGKVPILSYTYKNRKRRYFPDFYLPHLNQIVEVKSTYTAGFGNDTHHWLHNLKLKRKSCIKQGFTFKLLVMQESLDSPLSLPKDWYKLTKDEINAHLS